MTVSRIARHLRVTGRVQGVFYRAWTREEARELGLGGWVRNCSDGSVEAFLEGEPAAVEQLIDSMREGPPSTRVDDLTAKEVEPEGLDAFSVRH